MATLLFANNAGSTLAGAITNIATTLVLAAGTGALFPNPGVTEYFKLTLTDQATGNLHEIVHVTARAGDTLTVTRAQEGTPAQSWAAGDIAENLCTAGSLSIMVQQNAIVMYNVQRFATSTRVSMTGNVGNAYTIVPWSGNYTKVSPTSALLAWLATPSYTPGATGASGLKLTIGASVQQQLADNNIPGDARGQSATNVLFTGVGAGLLSWAVAYNRFDGLGWTTIFCPQVADNAYFPANTTGTLIICEAE